MHDTAYQIGISDPFGFEIRDNSDTVYFGGVQTWYRTIWQRRAGCGPTTASNIFAQLSFLDPCLAPLCPYDARRKDQFLLLMEEVWKYITPTWRGVNTCKILTSGAVRYAQDRDIRILPQVLDIPPESGERPDRNRVRAFLEEAFSNNLPVAFLNLCNGALSNLDRWHWVTLTSFDPDTLSVTMCDQGKKIDIDFALWLRESTLGGGLVALYR
ncbi:MAG: hypothetical protein FWE20_06310 [Defluviitaleaceae bacterium]|nr:hypothetical protein [Defluviitaleaceae bacterium]